MKLGLVARADNTGLGNQTFEFYRNMYPAKTMVVDISDLNKNKQYFERYPDAQIVHGFPRDGDLREFLTGLDVVFIAEAAYNPRLYIMAKELGVKTANQYNYEFFDWMVNPSLPMPDMFIAPSTWKYNKVDVFAKAHGIKHKYLHCPVNREALPYRPIKQARIFLHLAGKPAAHDRNGTETVIQATKHLETDAKVLLHFQGEQGLAHQATHTFDYYKQFINDFGDPKKIILQQKDFDDYRDVYKVGDVMVLPRRYGGNCLPMNEALSVGMPVLMPGISPNNQFLPQNWWLRADKVNEFTPRTHVDIYEVDPVRIARKIDYFYNMDEAAMVTESVRANNLAETISWKYMKWEYERAFESLISEEN